MNPDLLLMPVALAESSRLADGLPDDRRVRFVDLAAQHTALASEIDQALAGVFGRTDFVLGRDVHLLEEEFAAYCGVDYAIGVDSGTSALELALRAWDIGPGDEVITAANTFVATAFAISQVGATPVLVDVDPITYNLDATLLPGALSSRTRALIPVHLYGQPADMDPILAFACAHGLVVIEDACQAHGARYKGRRAGSLGHAAAFSFYPSKNLGACGEAGMVVTDNADAAERIRWLRNQGQQAKYQHVVCGHNHRLDTVQAAILRVKLSRLDTWNTVRRRRARLYTRLLAGIPTIVCPIVAAYAEPVYHLYVIRVAGRDALQTYLLERGIETGIHYPTPIHLQPAYRDLGYRSGSFPVTERYAGEILSLPMYAELPEAQCEQVAQAIGQWVARAA